MDHAAPHVRILPRRREITGDRGAVVIMMRRRDFEGRIRVVCCRRMNFTHME